MQRSSLLEQRYGAQIRHHQMKMDLGGEIRQLILQVLHEADHALTTGEITEKVKHILPKDIIDRMGCGPHYLCVSELVEGALTTLCLYDIKVGKKEVYYLLHKNDA